MKSRHNALRSLSPWLMSGYFLLGTWWGISLIGILIRNADQSFRTVILLAALAVGCVLGRVLDYLGHILGGMLGGFRLVMLRIGSSALVFENGKPVKRSASPETICYPVIMVPARKKVLYSFYLLGGPVLNLLLSLIAFFFLFLSSFSLSTVPGTFLSALVVTGIWNFVLSVFPVYAGYVPNDGLMFLQFCRDERVRQSVQKDLMILSLYSKNKDVPDQIFEVLSDDPDNAAMSTPRAVFLMRVYEHYIWKNQLEKASSVLAELYYHMDDFSDEFQILVIQESVYCLCLSGVLTDEELADRLISPARKKVYDQSGSPEGLRCLWIWSQHHPELREASSDYRSRLEQKFSMIPFNAVRNSWKNAAEWNVR